MNSSTANSIIRGHSIPRTLAILPMFIVPACQNEPPPPQPMLNRYVFDECSGVFREAAAGCILPWPKQTS